MWGSPTLTPLIVGDSYIKSAVYERIESVYFCSEKVLESEREVTLREGVEATQSKATFCGALLRQT
jgi:hypothetical protein